jgi:cytidylate kinase
MIITIDGPAAAGKSSTAKALARRLGFEVLDTGAMYRAVTLACLRAGVELNNPQALGQVLESVSLELHAGRVFLNREDVTDHLRTTAVTAASGPVADHPAVRRCLVVLQRAFARERDIITEGRDQGTVVFPDAACKFFLVADPVERARRRHLEMVARGEKVTLEEVLRAQEARDRRDAARDLAPMVPAPDAILLDSTHLALDEIVARMEQEVRRKKVAS